MLATPPKLPRDVFQPKQQIREKALVSTGGHLPVAVYHVEEASAKGRRGSVRRGV